jgi:hypothetical protein
MRYIIGTRLAIRKSFLVNHAEKLFHITFAIPLAEQNARLYKSIGIIAWNYVHHRHLPDPAVRA